MIGDLFPVDFLAVLHLLSAEVLGTVEARIAAKAISGELDVCILFVVLRCFEFEQAWVGRGDFGVIAKHIFRDK
jgi:hypothetical protein